MVEDEPDQPPSASWKFYNWDTGKYDSDESLSCTEFLNAPPCHLTIRLSGRAKELQGECEGEYEPTKMISMGRTVMTSFVIINHLLFLRFSKARWLKGSYL